MKDLIIKENRFTEKERRNLEILDSIRRGGEISRADISKTTDLNIVTISNYITKYIRNNAVLETGLDISTGGRRPELLKLNREYGYSLGIDLGAPHLTVNTLISAVIMDITGKILIKEHIKKEEESFEALTERVLTLAEDVVKRTGLSHSDIRGIGVGIWGVVDRYHGTVRYAIENERIVNYTTLLEKLEDKFNAPTIIEHDAIMAAFGERWSGLGFSSMMDNLVFLCSDSSCGLIIRGEPYYGATKSAGELNLNPPYPGEKNKSNNCWASYDYGCCLRSKGIDLGLVERTRSYFRENPEEKSTMLEMADGSSDKIDFNIVIEAAEKGDKLAGKFLEEAGEYLGVKVAFLINLFNPEVVIIGRGIEKGGDILFGAIRSSIRKWAYEEAVRAVKIVPTSLGEDAVAIGAAALVVQDIFARME